MLTLYKNIKKFRQEHEWTQEELATKIGYADKTMISRIEQGKVDLKQSQIIKFAEVFNVSSSKLMGFNMEEIQSDTKEQMIERLMQYSIKLSNEGSEQDLKTANIFLNSLINRKE